MRLIRYQVACSMDGFIAGPSDEFDWIIPEPTYDFDALHAQFDTILMGRRTYEIVRAAGITYPDKQVIVVSRSLRQEEHPDVEIVSEGLKERITELREQTGRDIWLYGGGSLFSQLLEWDLVDTFEPAYIPIILGGGVPLIAPNGVRRHLTYIRQHVYPSGMIVLEYKIVKERRKP